MEVNQNITVIPGHESLDLKEEFPAGGIRFRGVGFTDP